MLQAIDRLRKREEIEKLPRFVVTASLFVCSKQTKFGYDKKIHTTREYDVVRRNTYM